MVHIPSQRQIFLKRLAQTSDIPLGIEAAHAEGCFIFDTSGKKYLDLIAGISVSALGHGHPVVKQAVKEQVDNHMHLMVYGEYIQSAQTQYAALLTAQLPDGLDTVYFTNSGTEATEGAMKLAKRVTGRTGIIACHNAYHGSSQGALSIAGSEWLRNAFRPLIPGIRHIHYNSLPDLENISTATAAVFIETIQAEAGALVPSTGYMQALRERCSATGTLLVCDEIQAGYGRTGTFSAFSQEGIVPDILLLGKALGGGMPLGAFIASNALMSQLSHDPVLGHITTFGGHPVSCAAGHAALQYLLESSLMNEVAEKGNLFAEKLKHTAFKKLHGRGLLLALELENFRAVQKLIAHCLQNGLITDWFLFNDHCIRIAPPLTISRAEIELACEIIVSGGAKL